MTKLKPIITSALCALGLTGCALDPVVYDRPQPQTEAEIVFIKSVLNNLQLKSFELGREFCGYLLLNSADDFDVTKIEKGKEGTCRADSPEGDDLEIASFHTHGQFSPDYDSEYPSLDDVKADADEGIDGYVATPGGRVWYINGYTATATLLCDEGCIRADPNYVLDGQRPVVGQAYTLEDLENATELAE